MSRFHLVLRERKGTMTIVAMTMTPRSKTSLFHLVLHPLGPSQWQVRGVLHHCFKRLLTPWLLYVAPPLPPGPPPPLGYMPTFDAYGGMIPPPPPPGFGVAGYPMVPPPPPPPGFAVSMYPAGVPPPPPPPPGFAPAQVVAPNPFDYPSNHPVPPTYPTYPPPPPPGSSQVPPRPKGLPLKPSLPPPPPGLPSKPGAPPSGAVISAEPELRDLKKESTAFVPAALKRKQAEKDKDGSGKKARLDASS